MSDSDSVDMLTTTFQFTFVASSCKKLQVPASKQAKKKRKAAAAVSSAAKSDNEAAVANSSQNLSQKSVQNSQNAAYYLQLAISNLKIAAEKETEQSVQAKIQALTAKIESILLKNDSESESESVQNQLQIIRAEFADKFSQIQT